MTNNHINKNMIPKVEALKGIFRRTLIYDENLMLCHFFLEKGAEVPMHTHKEHQIGYVIKGKIKFKTDSEEFIATAGESYLFSSNEKHGAILLEDSELIDIFNPSREDYK
jgi:quercetin dioxygenase-like cupin family protein